MKRLLRLAFLALLLGCHEQEGWAADENWPAMAEAALGKRNYTNAIEAATRALLTEEKNPRLYYLRGVAYAQLNQPDKAILDYNTAIKLAPKLPSPYQSRGLELFKAGYFAKAVADFDTYLQMNPARRPYHWQRGIALYYAGDFDEGRKQFELHKTVNANDVENAVWHFLCVARAGGIEQARKMMIPIQDDSRMPMMAIWGLYKGLQTREDVLRLVSDKKEAPAHGLFYAYLYLGLFEKVKGNVSQAKSDFAQAAALAGEMEFMGDVAAIEHKMHSAPPAAPLKLPKK